MAQLDIPPWVWEQRMMQPGPLYSPAGTPLGANGLPFGTFQFPFSPPPPPAVGFSNGLPLRMPTPSSYGSYASIGPTNTAASVANLYPATPPAGALPPGGSTSIYNNRLLESGSRYGRAVPSTGVSYANPARFPGAPPAALPPGSPMGALPPGGSTGIYNNRFLQAQADALRAAQGQVGGAARPAGGVPTAGAIPSSTGQPVISSIDDALLAGGDDAAASLSRFLDPRRAITMPRGGRELLGAGNAAGLVRGLGYSVLGGVAADFADRANIGGEGSLIDQAAPGALRGAGYGAIAGPWGAALGGALGGVSTALDIPVLSSLFGGGGGEEGPSFDDQLSDFRTRASTAFDQAGVTPDQRDQFFRAMDAQLTLAGDDDGARAQMLDSFGTAALSMIQGAGQVQPGQMPQLSPDDILAIQAMAGEMTRPYADANIAQANTSADILRESAGALSPALSSAFNNQAATMQSNATRMSAALMGQAQSLPAMAAYQMAIQQAYQTPQSAPSDLNSILAGLGIAG